MADSASTFTAEDEEHQSAFVRTFLIVLGALILFTLFCMLMARMLSSGASGVENDPILKADVANRIAPVSSVRTTADADAGGGAVMQVAAAQSGEEIVQGVCSACHMSGVGGAPLLDDDAAWATLREGGLDPLLASVINGKGAMPARAGTQLSDEELRSAVAHMAGIEIEEAEAAPAATEGAATQATETATNAAAEEVATTESSSAETDSDASGTATAASATTTAATATAATATAAASTTAVVQNDAAGGTIVAAELSDRVKNTADGICVACHLSGVGGAPKIGDKVAWAARAEKGLAGMVAVVAAGKGAMPARGGSDLNDEELAAAINYLMAK